MAPQERSTFECDRCGAHRPTTRVEYGPLGYPVCPDCGLRSGPDATDAAATRERAPEADPE